MAINFCYTRHKPKISCNKVALDGYEELNLISEDEICRKRGFRGASFITTPVEIVLKFPYSIDISHLILHLFNGSQQTTACKVYTDVGIEGNNFHLIGSYDKIENSKLCLYNYRYRETILFSSFTYDRPEGLKLYPQQDSYVSCIHCLKICLTRTASSSVPVLSKLEVWGQPGTDSTQAMKQEIYDIEVQARKLAEMRVDKVLSEDVEVPPVQDNNTDTEPVVPPDDFLDAITYELMSQPILLPSGNSIDKSTLDKHIESSSHLGQLPADPFTGVYFSETNKPVSNIELKARIDNFWSTHPSACYGGRCIGIARLSTYKKPQSSSSSNNNNTSSNKSESIPTQKTSSVLNSNRNLNMHKLPMTVPTSLTPGQKIRHMNRMVSKTVSASSSLRVEPSYCSADKPPTEVAPDSCTICGVDSDCDKYRLPCLHILCRKCVVRETKFLNTRCKICGSSYKSSDVERYYGELSDDCGKQKSSLSSSRDYHLSSCQEGRHRSRSPQGR